MFHLVLAWEAIKEFFERTLGINHLVLHLVAGLALFMLFARLMRRPLGSAAPLIPVALLELLNEASDLTRYLVSGWPWPAGKTAVEVIFTVVPPTILMLIARWRTRNAAPAAAQAGSTHPSHEPTASADRHVREQSEAG